MFPLQVVAYLEPRHAASCVGVAEYVLVRDLCGDSSDVAGCSSPEVADEDGGSGGDGGDGGAEQEAEGVEPCASEDQALAGRALRACLDGSCSDARLGENVARGVLARPLGSAGRHVSVFPSPRVLDPERSCVRPFNALEAEGVHEQISGDIMLGLVSVLCSVGLHMHVAESNPHGRSGRSARVSS